MYQHQLSQVTQCRLLQEHQIQPVAPKPKQCKQPHVFRRRKLLSGTKVQRSQHFEYESGENFAQDKSVRNEGAAGILCQAKQIL